MRLELDAGDLEVLVEPLAAPPADPGAWLDATLRRALGRDETPVLGEAEEARTRDGWPVELVDVATATRRAVLARYRMSGHEALAIAVTGDRARAVAALLSARPVWGGIAGIADLFS